MHLFILGWNLPKKIKNRIPDELIDSCNRFPLLDKNEVWTSTKKSQVYAASIQGSKESIKPRVYVANTNGTATLYHGCMLDPKKEFSPWNAHALDKHWSSIDRLEGLYGLVRISTQEPKLEIQTDPLGVYQLYYYRKGNSWLISNNATAIRNLINISTLDPLGVSMYLSLGWAGDDRTLLDEVKVLPGGTRWLWEKNKSEPKETIYFDKKELATAKRRKMHKAESALLAEKLSSYFEILADNFNSLECPITAGYDSRAMVALLLHRNLPAQYFTFGMPESNDVTIGEKISETLGLNHKRQVNLKEEVIEDWPSIRDRLIFQNDGLVSLAQVYNAINYPDDIDTMKVHLFGIGGEIGRAAYYRKNEKCLISLNKIEYSLNALNKRITKHGLIKPKTRHLSLEYIESFCEAALNNGFKKSNLLDLFYAYERVRRWAGTNLRPHWSKQDEFSPFCTRPFIEASFSLPIALRQSDHIHYRLLSEISPTLNAIPYDKKWRNQSITKIYLELASNMATRRINRCFKTSFNSTTFNLKSHLRRRYYNTTRANLRSQVLEAVRRQEREYCMDHLSSPVWDFVNRSQLETLLAPETTAEVRHKHHTSIFLVLTLIHYASSFK